MGRALVLGGTGFMGRSTVQALLQHGHQVSVLNRGKAHWDQPEWISKVNQIIANRKNSKEFRKILSSSGEWEVVVDFTSFNDNDMRDIVEGLRDKVQHYIYISSDSVYEVSEPTNRPRKEEDSKRPSDPQTRQKLNENDDYGHGKFQCEEVLQETKPFPYTCLRLPDVLGPYDNTKRHWKHQLCLVASSIDSETFVQIPKKPHPLSFIFSEDVASLVIRVIEAGSITFGEAFNFGCFETPTMEEYLNEISRRLGITPRYQKKNDPKSFLPSVSFGPIDIGKAVSVLKMKPTPFSEVLRRTVEWHEDAWAKYPDLRPTCKLNLSEQAIVALGQHYQR